MSGESDAVAPTRPRLPRQWAPETLCRASTAREAHPPPHDGLHRYRRPAQRVFFAIQSLGQLDERDIRKRARAPCQRAAAGRGSAGPMNGKEMRLSGLELDSGAQYDMGLTSPSPRPMGDRDRILSDLRAVCAADPPALSVSPVVKPYLMRARSIHDNAEDFCAPVPSNLGPGAKARGAGGGIAFGSAERGDRSLTMASDSPLCCPLEKGVTGRCGRASPRPRGRVPRRCRWLVSRRDFKKSSRC